MRTRPSPESIRNLAKQQLKNVSDYTQRMYDEMAKTDDPNEKLAVAEDWIIRLQTYTRAAKENLEYGED